MICLHADDMLGIGDDLFDWKLKELVGICSMKRQKFDHCGSQYENEEVTISMKAYTQSLEKVYLVRDRWT